MRKVSPMILLAALVSAVTATLLVLAALGVVGIVGAFQGRQVSLADIKNGEVVLLNARTPAERFAILSRRHTNKCNLAPERLESIAVRGRLQGSCCSRMDLNHYLAQTRGLKHYRRFAEIPVDPYDIPVGQAKGLIAFNAQITLSPEQQKVYDAAVGFSEEHGPCCCHCWRWTAFEGQAKELIARRRFTAREIAKVWGLEDGCGGTA